MVGALTAVLSVEYCKTMARYNVWQNGSQSAVLAQISPAELKKNRKAFFGSIMATCNHLLWADQIWMSRIDGGMAPTGGIEDSVDLHDDVQLMLGDRMRTDARITRWAEKLTHVQLVGPLVWTNSQGKSKTMSKAICIAHFFNHQTHHRGQIHAMLTAAGKSVGPTDLLMLPDAI